ncbi:MAG TPA: hypothetical protein VGL71_14250 [Urbifossiella sp.]
MARIARLIILSCFALLILAAIGMWAYRIFGPTPATAIAIDVETRTVSGITFEVEFERRNGINLRSYSGPVELGFKRNDDWLTYDHGIIMINEIGMPDVKAGDVVRWNLEGPLLINGQPVQPHPLQAQRIEAEHTDLEWSPLPSAYPRDTLSIAWIGRSRHLAAAHGDGAIRIWDVDKAGVLKTMIPDPPKDSRGHNDFRISVSPDGKTIAAASVHSEEATLWDAATGTRNAAFSAPKGNVNALGFANNWLVEARGKSLFARNLVGNGRQVAEIGKISEQFPVSIAIGTATARIAWNDGEKIRIGTLLFDAKPPTIASDTVLESASFSGSLAFSVDEKLLAVFNGNRSLSIHDAKTAQLLHRLHWRGKAGTEFPITALAFSPDGHTLAIGTSESIRFYDVPSGRERGGMACPWVRSLAYSADGRTLAAGLQYRPGLRLWDTKDLVAREN